MQNSFDSINLNDKFYKNQGEIYVSGVQALVRLPLYIYQRDIQNNIQSGGFISGYRGSPLAGYDFLLWNNLELLKANNIVFQPGVNEELAATALWGTQQLEFYPRNARHVDGVFGIWYGKGPGVDRCSDVFKHANLAGTSKFGGVVAIAGDDHIAKSSTTAHQSDQIFMACSMPLFFPANVQEILDFGVHAIALSRFASVWTAMKTIQEIVESSSVINIDMNRVQTCIPELNHSNPSLHIRWPDDALEQEKRLYEYKWPAVMAYLKENRLNFQIFGAQNDRIGIIASGKAYNDTRQALLDLGLDTRTCNELGLRLFKVGVVWPLEKDAILDFAKGLKEILVIEEKRPVIEGQLIEILYHTVDKPMVVGKLSKLQSHHHYGCDFNTNDSQTLPVEGELNPAIISILLISRLVRLDLSLDIKNQLLSIKNNIVYQWEKQLNRAQSVRQPWFCSGCPHNTSTKIPEGSHAMAGIGCHFMSLWMDRNTIGFTQMGGEGVPWVGQQPFVKDQHIFANLGDGTYFHSGLLAIRQSIAAGVNITYKILYNSAVAMTGGQPIGESSLEHTPYQIAHSMLAEGAKKVVLVTDDIQKYQRANLLPAEVELKHREHLDDVQRQLREISGCTVIIYDQMCATEKRRKQKRGKMQASPSKVFINPLVCEGCGDCAQQSNCMSVEPIETEFGRKRKINQSTCTQDLSCVNGFCPSFVTITGGVALAQKQPEVVLNHLVEAKIPEITKPWGIVVAGIGGTGVITLGQIIGMAAYIEGIGVVTQDCAGLAQKGGATWSHITLAAKSSDILTTKISMGKVDLLLGCDVVVSTYPETLLRLASGRTHVVLNNYFNPTADFVKKGDVLNPLLAGLNTISETIDQEKYPDYWNILNAHILAVEKLGNSVFSNMVMLGFAWQKGLIPIHLASLKKAIELNGVNVETNLQAFHIGRLATLDLGLIEEKKIHWDYDKAQKKNDLDLDAMVVKRVEYLEEYQNSEYAQKYLNWVEKIKHIDANFQQKSLTKVVVDNLFRLMAYKDEYEVARLWTKTSYYSDFLKQTNGGKAYFHFAPTIFNFSFQKKMKIGAWIFYVLKGLSYFKFLRGGIFDLFSYSKDRKLDLFLLNKYLQSLELVSSSKISEENYQQALELLKVTENVKGYGHVRALNAHKIIPNWNQLLENWSIPRWS